VMRVGVCLYVVGVHVVSVNVRVLSYPSLWCVTRVCGCLYAGLVYGHIRVLSV